MTARDVQVPQFLSPYSAKGARISSDELEGATGSQKDYYSEFIQPKFFPAQGCIARL